jgi:hypothetical protein
MVFFAQKPYRIDDPLLADRKFCLFGMKQGREKEEKRKRKARRNVRMKWGASEEETSQRLLYVSFMLFQVSTGCVTVDVQGC